MRFATVGSIVVFLMLAGIVLMMQRAEHGKIGGAVGCKGELVLIDYWKALRVIGDIRHEGNDLLVIVDWRSWARLPRSSQLAIGKAAYCPVALERKRGVARIVDINDNEFARIARGKWSSKQFPE